MRQSIAEAGMFGVLVLSGEATLKDVETSRVNIPLVVKNISKPAELLIKSAT